MRGVSYFLRLCRERTADGGRESVPVVRLFAQTPAARGGEFVKLGPAIVLRSTPLRLQQPLTHQPKQPRIESTLLDQQRITGDLPDAQQNAAPVQRAQQNNPQTQKLSGAG